MNRQLKAKIKYMFFNFLRDFHPDSFTFEGKKYHITNKDKLKLTRYPDAMLFTAIVFFIRYGIEIFYIPLYWALLIAIVTFIIYDWKRLPKNIFEYLELE